MWLENLVANLKSDWKHKSISATSRTLAPLAIIGGVSGLPLSGVAMTLYGLATGRRPDEDLKRWVRNKVADNNYLENLALYGITGNSSFSRGVGVQIPILDTLADQLTQDSWWDKLFSSNVPVLMTAKQIGQGLTGVAAGTYNWDVNEIVKGLFQAAPIPGNKVLRNIIKTQDAYYDGYNTSSGKKIAPAPQGNPFSKFLQVSPQIIGVSPNKVGEYYEEQKYKKLSKSPFGKATRKVYRRLVH